MTNYSHLKLQHIVEAAPYSSKGRGTFIHAKRINTIHAQQLSEKLNSIWSEAKERKAHGLYHNDGIYLEVRGAQGYELALSSLDSTRSGIKLLNVKKPRENDTTAQVYISLDKIPSFLKKISDYGEKKRNKKLFDNIEDIRPASLKSLWTDDMKYFPSNKLDWFEIWIRNEQSSLDRFLRILKSKHIEHKTQTLNFPERIVFFVKANTEHLLTLIDNSEYIAEIRAGRFPSSFYITQSKIDQHDIIDKTLSRTSATPDSSIICILDSGLNAHPLLAPFVPEEGFLTVKNEWGTNDIENHGTLTAGVSLYGDLKDILSNTTTPITINSSLISVKLFNKNTDKELWGELTKQAASIAETKNPNRSILYCNTITAKDSKGPIPTSWSASIDDIAVGVDGGPKRLFITSAGNIEVSQMNDGTYCYPISNTKKSVEDPSQAWNALTVGAYTKLIEIRDSTISDAYVLAGKNQLSPFSTTSCNWDKMWPIKPDVIYEGGNVLVVNSEPDLPYNNHENLEVLTTSGKFNNQMFETINATSAAAAGVSRIAATLQTKYPRLWPETIRALIVNSSKWTKELLDQFNIDLSRKSDVSKILRIAGYGIPDEEKALNSQENFVTLIAEEEITPFKKENGKNVTFNQMHFYNIPWPKDVLKALPNNITATVSITLSYFIEPSPGQKGWKDKYKYQSHGLRFDLKNPIESEDQFRSRINNLLKTEEDIPSTHTSRGWLIGNQRRTSGSIHSDRITTSVVDLLESDQIAVYPVSGWWKNREFLKKYNSTTRYALVISLEIPQLEVDIYNPIKTQIEAIIKQKTPIKI